MRRPGFELDFHAGIAGTRRAIRGEMDDSTKRAGDIAKVVPGEGGPSREERPERDEVEAARRATEGQFRELANSIPQLVWIASGDGFISWYNQRWYDYTGTTAEQMEGWGWQSVHDPRVLPLVLKQWMASIASGEPMEVEFPLRGADGQFRMFLTRAVPLKDDTGKVVRWFGTNTDVDELKRIESSLRAGEAKLNETNRALLLLSRCNEALTRSENEHDLISTVCRIAVEDGGFRLAWVGYTNDDGEQWMTPQAHAGFDDGYLAASRVSWAGASRTGQGPVARAVRSGQAVVIRDVAADPSFAPSLEAARQRGFRGVVCLPLKHASQSFGVLVLYLPEIRSLQENELRVLNDLADDLAFGIVNLRSQAERRRLQSALQKVATGISASTGAQFFEQLATSMAEAVGARAGVVARLLPSQPASARTIAAIVDGHAVPNFDYPLQGTPCEGLVERQDCIVLSRAWELFAGPPPVTSLQAQAYVGRRLDDSSGVPMGLVYVVFSAPLKSTEFISSTLHIFATRAAVELERQSADARLREQASLLDQSQDAILVRDLQHQLLYWNKSAEKRYGWSAAEALGRSARDLLSDDLAEFNAATKATLERGEWVGELHKRHKDGAPVSVEGRWTLVRDDDGTPKSILTVDTDLTERKRLERAEEQLRQAQKMEAVGSLAGGVAHDFNNLLTVILSYAELIISGLLPGDPLRPDMEEVKKAGLRATELTRQLLAFSRKQILQPVVLDLNQVVANVQRMLGRLLGEAIELSVLTSPEAARVHADAGQLEQVIMNLVLNSRDAMPDGGNVTIETANLVLDQSYAAEHAGVASGRYVLLTVADTGFGMDRATQSRIFEPFFTTKDKSKGTGLGLPTVYGIVQQSGGHVSVQSELGKGTTFSVYLPRSDRNVESHSPPTSVPVSLRGTETILLVEDEDQVRAIIRTILSKHGYQVLEAQNGGEAFLVCEQFPRAIQLLLTDVVMPRMNGRQLAERLKSLRPEMKVLFVSGYTDDTIVHHGILDGALDFLAKPIMPEALLRKVRQMLDARATALFVPPK